MLISLVRITNEHVLSVDYSLHSFICKFLFIDFCSAHLLTHFLHL